MNVGIHFMSKDVPLITNKSISKIKHGLYFMSLAINLCTRHLTLKHYMCLKIKLTSKINLMTI